MYGCLPKCPSCGGGTLRVSYQSRSGHNGQGHFSCPGYMDDDEVRAVIDGLDVVPGDRR